MFTILIVLFFTSNVIWADENVCQKPYRCVPFSKCKNFNDTTVMFPCQQKNSNSSVGTTMICCNTDFVKNNTSLTQNSNKTATNQLNSLPTLGSRIRVNQSESQFPEDCGISLVNRVSNGENATIGEHPWMVLLGYTTIDVNILQFYCGGSLITNRYVLTAAHCVRLEGVNLTVARFGELNIETSVDCYFDGENNICADPVVDVSIEKIIPHPKFGDSLKDDIALLRLAKDVTFTDYIRPICLPFNINFTSNSYANKTFTIAGWGKTSDDTFMGSSILQYASVIGWNLTSCNKIVPPKLRPIVGTQICAAGLKGQDSCKGDSGGPLTNVTNDNINKVRRNYQIGIVSLGIGNACGNDNIPSIYTRIEKYLKWIKNNVK